MPSHRPAPTTALPRALRALSLPLLLALTPWGAAQAAPKAQATAPPAPSAPDVFHDTERQLAWSMCVEGARWTGQACEGRPQWVDRAGAFQLATARRERDQAGWRLPSVKELQRLAQLLPRVPPAQRPRLAAGDLRLYWTDSVRVNTNAINPYRYDNVSKGLDGSNVNRLAFLHGWAVDMDTGSAEEVTKRTPLPVLLVRPLNPPAPRP